MEVKFITLNLWRGGILIDSIIKFLKNERPGVLAVQEVYDGKGKMVPPNYQTISVFKKKLDYQYFKYAPAFLERTDVGKINCGNAIFSQFPIVFSKTTFFDFNYRERNIGTVSDAYTDSNIKDFLATPRNFLQVDIKLDKNILHVINLHGIWGLDGRDNPRRLKMGRKVIETIKNKKNVILAGDFNMDANTKTIANIEKYLRNVFKNELTTTFNMKRKTKPGYATAVVDMILISPNIKVVKHYCPPVDLSDHMPLVAVFDI